jgi:D-3-phosphoglycerate dehydrogenase
VNAPAMAEERGISVVEAKHTTARDYTDLVRVEVSSGAGAVRVAGTLIGRQNRPHLLEAWGQRFDVQLEEHVTLFRYRDLPGMLGRVGTAFGAAGVNIISAAVGRLPEGVDDAEGLAAMAITTSEPVPDAVVEEIASSEEFVLGVTVALV